MKWVCSNCGNHFESEDRQVRCPACLRRNGLIPEEDTGKKTAARRKPFPWKPAAGAGILVLAALAAWAIWTKFSRPAPTSSRYGQSGANFAQLRTRVAQNTGLELTNGENPFADGPQVRDLARAWGGDAKAVMQKLQEAAAAGLVWTPKKEFRFPNELAAAVKAGSARASSLEWALLGHALGVALKTPVALGIARFAPGKEAHPWGLGVYAVGVFPDGFDKPAASWTPAAGTLQPDQWRPLDAAEVLAAALSQQALAKAACLERPLEAILPRDNPRSVPDEDAHFASARLQAAAHLAPEFPVVRAAAVWAWVCMGMNRKANQAAAQLVSTHEMLRQKAAGETFLHEQDFRRLSGMRALTRILERDFAVAQDVQAADAEFSPLNVLAAMGMEKGPDLNAEIDRLPASDVPEIRFLRIEGIMGIQDEAKRRERAGAALQDARALVQAFPDARWPLSLLFGALLETDGFEEARQLVPRMTRGLPDEAQEAEGLMQVIATSEERRKKNTPEPSSSP